MRPSTAAVHIGFARSKETICVYCDTGLGLLPKRGYHHITKRGCALSVHLPLTNHLQFRKPIHKSFYHATRDIHEKISSNIFFQRPTFLIKRLHLQHVVATDSLKHLDDCYEYHSKTRYRDTLKKVRSIWWSADFKEPLTGQVVRMIYWFLANLGLVQSNIWELFQFISFNQEDLMKMTIKN
jgi:hypothetical protein